jgi:PAS domain S-box-containing protein
MRSTPGTAISAFLRPAAITYPFRIVILMAFFWIMIAPPLSSRPLTVSDNLTRQKMGACLDYYVDHDGKVGINEASSRSLQGMFRPLPKEDFSFGYTSDIIWLRATIINKTGHVLSWLLECEYPLIDDICFYMPQGNGYSDACTGDRRLFKTRPINYRTFIFPVSSPPGESVCYVRMSSGGSLNISFRAWGRDSFQEKKDHESIFIWLFYGVMLSLAIYNLLIYISTRDMSYLFLSLFATGISLHSMSYNGLAFQFLWPDYPAWGNIANMLFNSISCIFAVLFSRSFLDTRLNLPRFDRFLLGLIAVLSISLLLSLRIDYHIAIQMVTFLAGFVSFAMIISVLYLLARGSRPAFYYLIAWLCLILGVLLVVLHSFGLLHEGFLSIWGYQIGSSLLVILLSLGIADKINIMRKEREQALEATHEAEEKYRALIETTDTGYVIIDDRGRVIDANAEYVRLAGYLTIDDIINKSVSEWTAPEDREKNTAAVESCMRLGFIRNLEVDYMHENGTVLPVEINATVIESKMGRRIISICRDITYRRTVFQNLMTSLRQKEILLKEVHHRVKNNLQIIASLLSLQANKISDADTLKNYEDMNNRIRAMSLIHERLYQTNDFARVDLADYIKIIAHDLRDTYVLNGVVTQMEFDTEPLLIDLTQAIPCGLMINEILSNIFKYAFPRSFSGNPAISISLHELDDSNVELIIGDNGIGLPETIDLKDIESLGLSLIFLLAIQLRGSVEIDKAGGTKFTIRFKLNITK